MRPPRIEGEDALGGGPGVAMHPNAVGGRTRKRTCPPMRPEGERRTRPHRLEDEDASSSNGGGGRVLIA